MENLEVVYILRRRINNLENKLKRLTCENVQGNREANRRTVARICKVEAQIIRLKGVYYDKINSVYSNVGTRLRSASPVVQTQMKIIELDIGDSVTKLKMAPIWFKIDRKKATLKDVIYPNDATDRNILNVVARYRAITNKSINFRHQPLEISQDSIETVIIGLDSFVHQFEGEMSFTNEDICFSDSVEHLSYGIACLGSVHLLATDFIPTAKFSFKFNLNYDRALADSNSSMKEFVLDLNKSIARVLHCKNEFIRIFSIEKTNDKYGSIKVSLGLTTPDKLQTQSLARHFQFLVRRSDFSTDNILRYIQTGNYQFELISVVSYLQLSSNDFDSNKSRFYDAINSINDNSCEEYHLRGWYRHALNFNKKYSDGDDTWFNSQNSRNGWRIAYHGTSSPTSVQQSRSSSILKTKHLYDNNSEMKNNQSGIYIFTKCNGGADRYTTSFTISNGYENQTFQIVFQCRLKPNSISIDSEQLEEDQPRMIADPTAVRPYALLIKNDTSSL